MARVLDANLPGPPVSPRPHGAQISRQVHDGRFDSEVLEPRGDPVGRVFLPDTSEIHLHSFPAQEDGAVAQRYEAPVEERHQRRHLFGGRHLSGAEVPDPAQRADRGRESSLRALREVERFLYETYGLLIDRHGGAAGVAVDAGDDTAGEKAGILALDPLRFVDGPPGDRLGLGDGAIRHEADQSPPAHDPEAFVVESAAGALRASALAIGHAGEGFCFHGLLVRT
ncbi:MAG TPA: hypothetical protein VFW45_11375 [Candidatus Polarisedimenticolia bacterium]|nr:hypothetical protein [Candidatus Polarisedimenticolia bacterium]